MGAQLPGTQEFLQVWDCNLLLNSSNRSSDISTRTTKPQHTTESSNKDSSRPQRRGRPRTRSQACGRKRGTSSMYLEPAPSGNKAQQELYLLAKNQKQSKPLAERIKGAEGLADRKDKHLDWLPDSVAAVAP